MTSGSLRWLRRSGLGLLVTLLAIQFVPYGRVRVNPPVVAEPPWDSPITRALARQACFDCHSNETQRPVYARIAPASWLIEHDVTKARAVLNFSEWQRPQGKARDAAEEARDRQMPPAMYRLMHAHARLSDAEQARISRGLDRTLGRLDMLGERAQR